MTELITTKPSSEYSAADDWSVPDDIAEIEPDVVPGTPNTGDGDSSWGYTEKAFKYQVVGERQDRERAAGRKVRETIGKDTQIDQGVYEGTYGGEKIVVDLENSPFIRAALETIKRTITNTEGRPDKDLAMDAVFQYVKENMAYDQDKVDEIFRVDGDGKDGKKISLDVFVENKAGVCRHQALFAGALLESLKNEGILTGQVSVDRNEMKINEKDKDGHAWTRYTTSRGEVYILDIAQLNGVVKLDDLMRARMNGNKRVWDYGRPEDHVKLQALIEAENAAEFSETVEDKRLDNHEKADNARSGARAELDEKGMLIMPDWLKNFNGDSTDNSNNAYREAQTADKPAEQPVKQEKSANELIEEKFWAQYDNAITELDGGIDRAGHIDPSMMAGRAYYEVMMASKVDGINPLLAQYLKRVQDLLDEVYQSGNNMSSRFYRNQAQGLSEARAMLTKLDQRG